MMCKCHKRSNWYVRFEYDEGDTLNGYDGDTPLDAERTWHCYNVVIERECTRCGERDTHDVLGACWASDDSEGSAYLDDTARGMLPRGITFDDCEVCYA